MRSRDWACLGLTGFAAYCCGFVEVRTTEVASTIGVLLLTGLLLGFARPKRFWLWAFILGAAVPFSHVVAPFFGLPQKEPLTGLLSFVAVGAFAVTIAACAGGAGAGIAYATAE